MSVTDHSKVILADSQMWDTWSMPGIIYGKKKKNLKIDQRPKYKNKTTRKYRINLCGLRLEEDFLSMTPKVAFIREIHKKHS